LRRLEIQRVEVPSAVASSLDEQISSAKGVRICLAIACPFGDNIAKSNVGVAGGRRVETEDASALALVGVARPSPAGSPISLPEPVGQTPRGDEVRPGPEVSALRVEVERGSPDLRDDIGERILALMLIEVASELVKRSAECLARDVLDVDAVDSELRAEEALTHSPSPSPPSCWPLLAATESARALADRRRDDMSTTDLTKPRLLTVKEAALKLRCSPLTVRRRIREGQIPAIQLGGPGNGAQDSRGRARGLAVRRSPGRGMSELKLLTAPEVQNLAMLADPAHLRFSGFDVRCSPCPGPDGCCRHVEPPPPSLWRRLVEGKR
jgi:excisionase family DNA binding protein